MTIIIMRFVLPLYQLSALLLPSWIRERYALRGLCLERCAERITDHCQDARDVAILMSSQCIQRWGV